MLGNIKWVLFVGALVLAVTKPSAADVERLVKDMVVAEIMAANLDASNGFLENFATVACKIDMDSCYAQIRPLIKIEYSNKMIFSSVGITAGGRKTDCIGLVKQLFCPQPADP